MLSKMTAAGSVDLLEETGWNGYEKLHGSFSFVLKNVPSLTLNFVT